MKNTINSIKSNSPWAIIILIAGIFLGWLFFHTPANRVNKENMEQSGHEGHDHSTDNNTQWTCSMHPQIKQDKPGQCPICAMDLVPVSSDMTNQDNINPDEIQMTESAAKLADIQTYIVKMGSPDKVLYLQGKVQTDERRISVLTARFGGRIEKLHVSFTGENVARGQKLATIYSPELVTAQRELLIAMKNREDRPGIYNAARSKLRLWDLTEAQIDAVEERGEPQLYFDILSPISGTVSKRQVSLGDYVKVGKQLFEVVDLTRVWIMLDAYESDLPWIQVGDKVKISLQSLPGRTLNGQVTYIDPFIDAATRVAKIRIEQSNHDLTLKPGMFVNGVIKSNTAKAIQELLIPKSSILWTGKRAVVYVKLPGHTQPTFVYREIELGPESGANYAVYIGLAEGEEIAVNGVFKIDAAAQLAGKTSMMNQRGDREIVIDGFRYEKYTGRLTEEQRSFLDNLLGIYLKFKDQLVKAEYLAARIEISRFKQTLDQVPANLLDSKAEPIWSDQINELEEYANLILNAKNIDQQRGFLKPFSAVMVNLIVSFGSEQSTVFVQFCPMADDDSGAYWLSENEEILNPYFGDQMLNCGLVKYKVEPMTNTRDNKVRSAEMTGHNH